MAYVIKKRTNMAEYSISLAKKDEAELQKFKSDSNVTLIGTAVYIDKIESIIRPDVERYPAFFGVNPMELGSSVSEMNIEFVNTSLSQSKQDDIREWFNNEKDGARLALLNTIQRSNPDFFDRIEKICNIKNKEEHSVAKRIIENLVTPNAKMLLLMGLPGYAKSSTIRAVYDDLRNANKSAKDIAQIYNISINQAEKAKKNVPSDFFTIPINNGLELADLFALKSIKTDPVTNASITVTNNAPLLSAIKAAVHTGRRTMINFDEICDNPNLLLQGKSCFMPDKNNNYVFASAEMGMERNFVILQEQNIRIDGKKNDYVIFEVGNLGDGMFAVDDSVIEISKDKNSIDIQSEKINFFARRALNYSILNEKEKNFFNSHPNNKLDAMKSILNVKMNNLNQGNTFLLISAEKYKEIMNSNITSKLISTGAPYVVNKNVLQIFGTGNQIADLDPATRARWEIVIVDGIYYDDLKKNIVNGIGINSELYKILNDKYPDKSATRELTQIVLNFVKNIARAQHQGEIRQPDFSDDLPFTENKLSSIAFSPRSICEIINASSTVDDIAINIRKRVDDILGIKGVPNDSDLIEKTNFFDCVDSTIDVNLKKFAKKYKLKSSNNIKTKLDDALNELPTLSYDNTQQDENKNTRTIKL